MTRFIIAVLAILFNGCSTIPEPQERILSADNMAQAAGLSEATVGNGFPLHAYIRIGDSESKKIRLYIEGDGFAYVTRSAPSPDPTPIDPTSLRLAAADNAPNVAYVARPCQFNSRKVAQCERRFWTSDRYSQDVVKIFHEAIDDLKENYSVDEIEIVGFSGGATIAAVLTAERKDIHSLRTVAGNLDLREFVAHHKISNLPASVDPAKYSSVLDVVPQLHVVGERDRIIPESIIESFLSRQGVVDNPFLSKIHVVPDMSHFGDWDFYWPGILSIPLR